MPQKRYFVLERRTPMPTVPKSGDLPQPTHENASEERDSPNLSEIIVLSVPVRKDLVVTACWQPPRAYRNRGLLCTERTRQNRKWSGA
jgi:hypothetical protein